MSNPNQVAGGYKAALKNPHVSDEAKEHARDLLENDKIEGADTSDFKPDGKDPINVAAGLKGALKNPNVSEEAKEQAQEKLDKM